VYFWKLKQLASNLIKINQGKKRKHQMANKVLPYLDLYMSNSEKGSTHQIHMEEVVLGLQPPKHPFRIERET
jgi:hypothetical protein